MLSTDESRNVSDIQKISLLFETSKTSTRGKFSRLRASKSFRFQLFAPIDLHRLKGLGLLSTSPQGRRIFKWKCLVYVTKDKMK